MPPKAARKVDSAMRVVSAGGKHGDATVSTPKKVQIWPEWSEADINAEKWEVQHKGGKDKDKSGKSPVVQQFFEDPEGKLDLPQSLRVTHWKRPHEFILDKTPTVVDLDEGQGDFDLFTKNEACCESELIRYIVSEITALWKATEVKAPVEATSEGSPAVGSMPEELIHEWKPWEHIYALSKVGKGGPNIPLYNSHGKYVVRLYWMGCWRKLVVDDTIPFDEEDRMLLPATSLQQEIWPMILTKALIRVASLEYSGGNRDCEFGDFCVAHCLMGWIPEMISLEYKSPKEVWKLLARVLPNFKLPELPSPEKEKAESPVKPDSAGQESGVGPLDEGDAQAAKEKDKPAPKADKADSKMGKVKDKGGKESKATKDKAPQNVKPEGEAPIPETPETLVFANFNGAPRIPARTLALAEMSETSECLRQNNISYLYPHPVWLKQSRDCPLERPPPPEIIPKWKLIRPRKPKEIPSAEPKAAPSTPPPPIQVLELSSPFLNYKVSPVPITVNDLSRPKSGVLERGGTRPGTSLAGESFDETEEEGRKSSTKCIKEVAYTLPQIVQPHPTPVPSSVPISKRRCSKGADKEKSQHSAQLSSAKSSVTSKTKSGAKQKKEEHAKPQKGETPKKADTRNDSARTTKSEKVVKAPIPEAEPVVPVIPPAEEGSFAEPPADEALPTDVEPKVKDIWMDFEVFTRCFKNLVIYHKPHTYPTKVVLPADLKPVSSPARDDKTPQVLYNDAPPQYLFVDNVKTSEIIVSLTAVSHWPESAPALPPSAKPPGAKTPELKPETAQGSEPALTPGSAPAADEAPKEKVVLTPGSVIAEPHSWKTVAIHLPVLRIQTTATKAAALVLPPGRHVLKFMVSAPLAYQLSLVSSVKFYYGSEEEIMPHLTAESCRFVEYATETVSKLGKCIQNFSDTNSFSVAMMDLLSWACPYQKKRPLHRVKVFNEALYAMLKRALPSDLLTQETAFSIRCLLCDVTTPNILGLGGFSGSRPATGLSTSHRSSAKAGKGGGKSRTNFEPDKVPDFWVDREPTVDELIAQVKISKSWRAYYVRKIIAARRVGTPEHTRVSENLNKVWAALEPGASNHGLLLYKVLFKADGSIMENYPFHADEWSKILYSDYQGSYPEQAPGSWFVVFREIFYVHEPTFCVPKLYTPGLLCLLRVIDNDTGEQTPMVFQRVMPHLYKPNKTGYTFVAEARAPQDKPVVGGKATLRLIGSHTALPTPARSEVMTSFTTKEIQDYYIPRESYVILRYKVKVLEENHLASIQLQTSRPDVYVRLQILDRDKEVRFVEGKGHIVLPAFLFETDRSVGSLTSTQITGADASRERRPSSRGSTRGGNRSAKKRDKGSTPNLEASSSSPLPPGGSSGCDIGINGEDQLSTPAPHKYVIQALVRRDSWPLNQVQWAFVNDLKEQEQNDLKVYKMEGDTVVPKDKATPTATAPAGGSNPGKGGGGGGKGKGKETKSGKEKSSRPASVQFDVSKPHWLLRVISDGPAQPPEPPSGPPARGSRASRPAEGTLPVEHTEDIEITKDTDRADEIRAIKRAWEEAEPGRAAKAYQSRLRYLKASMVKNPEYVPPASRGSAGVEGEEAEEPTTPEMDEADLVYTLEPPPSPAPKEILPPLDLTPFRRKMYDTPRYFDEEEQRRQQSAREKEFSEYSKFRDAVLKWREENLKERNDQKVAQLEFFERMQAKVDEERSAVNAPREAFRQKYLEAERKRLEEQAAQEASLKAQTEKVASPKAKRSAKGRSAKKK